MSFLNTKYKFSDGYENYFQNILTVHMIPVIATLFGLFFVRLFNIIYKLFFKKTTQKNTVNKSLFFISLFFSYISLITLISYYLPWNLEYVENNVNDLWDYKTSLVSELNFFNNGIAKELNGTVACENNFNCDQKLVTDITFPLSDVINTLRTTPSLDIVDSIKDSYKTIAFYVSIFSNGTLAFYIIATILVLVLTSQPDILTNFKKTTIFIFLFVAFLVLIISIINFFAATVISDICKNTTETVDYLIDDENLNFYLSCSPTTKNISLPPILNDYQNLITILSKKKNTDAIQVKCENGQLNSLADIATGRWFLQFTGNFNESCCSGCDNNTMAELIQKLGNDVERPFTGLWSKIDCAGPYYKKEKTITAICELFPNFFSNFVIFLFITIHLLLLF